PVAAHGRGPDAIRRDEVQDPAVRVAGEHVRDDALRAHARHPHRQRHEHPVCASRAAARARQSHGGARGGPGPGAGRGRLVAGARHGRDRRVPGHARADDRHGRGDGASRRDAHAHGGLLGAAGDREGRGLVVARGAGGHRAVGPGDRADAGRALPADLQPRPRDAVGNAGLIVRGCRPAGTVRAGRKWAPRSRPRGRTKSEGGFGMRTQRESGFTLMELMVVIVIVAILAAVAVPLYVNYVRDAQRTEAKGAIGAVITAEQTWFQVNNTYTKDTFAPNAANQKLNCDLTDALTNWDISVTDANAGGFTVVANGKAGGPTAGTRVQLLYSRTDALPWSVQCQ